MADRTDKVESNVSGKYSVDSGCIDCDVCRETAPNNFRANEDEGYSHIFTEPETEEEESQCRDAVESCPVDAIGDDGDEPQESSARNRYGSLRNFTPNRQFAAEAFRIEVLTARELLVRTLN